MDLCKSTARLFESLVKYFHESKHMELQKATVLPKSSMTKMVTKSIKYYLWTLQTQLIPINKLLTNIDIYMDICV